MLTLATTVCVASSLLGGSYLLHADFSVKDERNRSPHIDIEENTSYAHAHGRVIDGTYEIVVQGNRHFLAAPKLKDFKLDFTYTIRPYQLKGELGFLVYFRWNRDARRGDVLKVFHDADSRFHVTMNDREIFTRQDGEKLALDNQTASLVVNGTKGTLNLAGTKIDFELSDGAAGAIGFDSTFSPSEIFVLSDVTLASENAPEKTPIGTYSFVLDRCQGTQVPLRYDVTLERYTTGETELNYHVSGTSADFKPTIETGGGEWGRLWGRLTEPYLRVETAAGEYCNILLYNGFRQHANTQVIRKKAFVNEGWPLDGAFVFRDFPSSFALAAGYNYFVCQPWRFVANGPYEQIRGSRGAQIYEGDSIRNDRIAVKAIPNADNATARAIPKDVPRYSEALTHAQRGGYFREGEEISFVIETTWRASKWSKAEVLAERPQLTTVFDEPMGEKDAYTCEEISDEELEGGFRQVRQRLTLAHNPGHGVWKLALRGGKKEIFEVLSDKPNALPPPMASGLPFLVSMPNEDKYLEQNAFDPWNFFYGRAHYYAVDNQYPAVGNATEIWRVLPLYNRGWWCWNWNRNSDDLDQYSDRNCARIRHSRFYGGWPEGKIFQSRYDFSNLGAYWGHQLQLLHDYVAEKKPPLKLLTLARLEEAEAGGKRITFEEIRDLFNTCWDDFIAWARVRIVAAEKKFTSFVLDQNPSVGLASYGPFPVYVARYKTAYILKYMCYQPEMDPRVRANGSFWVFEEYHHSCDYPVYRAALWLTSYCLNHAGSRKIYPEIYSSSWGRCNDGAVFQAHPFPGGRYVHESHQRKVAYTYAYGTPYFKDGTCQYWRDWGFHARSMEAEALDHLVYAWGKFYRNQSVKSAKAPFIVVDEAQFARRGEYFDDEYNTNQLGKDFLDICNTAEEGVAYAYEKACEAGYTTPVLTTLDELDAISPSDAEFVVLPPIVKGTPEKYLAAIRRAAARGVNLLCSESCVGLEDLFGVKEVEPRAVGYVPGEAFTHKQCVAHYLPTTAKATLWGAAKAGATLDIPIVMTRTGTSRTAFINVPPSCVLKNSFRGHFHWGSDSISKTMKKSMVDTFAYLAPTPAVKTERGTVLASYTEKGDLMVVLEDDSPNYNDPATYPVLTRLTIAIPGIGARTIETDAPSYAFAEKSADRVVLRVPMEKDTAYYFKLSK